MIRPANSGMSADLAHITDTMVATASLEAQLADAVTGRANSLATYALLPVSDPWAYQNAPAWQAPGASAGGATIGT